MNPSLDTTFYGTQRNCGNDPLDGELDLVKKFNEANKTYFDVYMLQLLLSDSGPVFTNKELNKIFDSVSTLKPSKNNVLPKSFFPKGEYRADFDSHLFVNVKCRQNHE